MTVFAGFDDGQAVLAVQGDVDLLAVPKLGVFFDAVTASGYPSVVLDVTGMDSIDAAGLTVIVSAASSLVASGGRLTIRSSLSEIAWVLDSSWLAGLISLELTGLSDKRLGSEQAALGSAKSLRMALPEATEHLSGVTAVPTSEGVVNGALRLVVALARAMVDGADGASVTLRRHGRLSTVAATDQTVLDMDSEQYAGRRRTLHRGLDHRTLVPRGVARGRDTVADLYAQGTGIGYQRDSLVPSLGRRSSGGSAQHLLAYGDSLRGARSRNWRASSPPRRRPS